MAEEGNRWLRERSVSGEAYDATYDRRAAAGENVHGEADFVQGLGVRSVLDAGCGTGRVGRELARRGLDVVGVDIDPEMLATARARAPEVAWELADLAEVDLGRTFEAVVMAGNVMIFVTPGSEGEVVANMARHVGDGGYVVAGFQLAAGRLGIVESQMEAGRLSVARYDELAAAAGLELAARFATWDREPWVDGGGYAVSVHRKAGGAG
jgi:SAM-dependent methyltransferase